jgi:hypothetical protein
MRRGYCRRRARVAAEPRFAPNWSRWQEVVVGEVLAAGGNDFTLPGIAAELS